MGEAGTLVESILDQAKEEANGILAEARAKAEARLAKAKEDLALRVADIEAEAERRAALEERRIATAAELEVRRERLRAKADLLDEAFAGAYRALLALPEEEWRSFVRRLLLAAAVNGDEQVMVPSGQRERYAALLGEVNEELRRRGRRGELRLAEEAAGIEAGFVLIGPEYTVDSSFRALLAEVRSVLEPEVARILFARGRVGG